MADGTRRDSIEGLVIRNKDFYQVLDGIINKTNRKDLHHEKD